MTDAFYAVVTNYLDHVNYASSSFHTYGSYVYLLQCSYPKEVDNFLLHFISITVCKNEEKFNNLTENSVHYYSVLLLRIQNK